MPYSVDEGGRLNNFAVEPKMYKAQPPSNAQKRYYIVTGILGIILVGGLIFVAFSVS